MPTISRRSVVWVALFLWLVGVPFAMGVVPWALSLLGPRLGWDGRPAPWNWLGAIPVVLGAVGLGWVALTQRTHLGQLPQRVSVDWSPKILVTKGPYAFSRHPMYMSEQAIWLGWALFHGSVVVGLGWLAMALVQPIVARREERDLEARFGEAYRAYARRVPRWIGRRSAAD